ncbi:MAG: hypothetical protein SFU25_07195 [Candidatus Caenarcaniphilales bacterium]|nr:hypothetical protein [Candidatus Caenarcaniphilales bacterium]
MNISFPRTSRLTSIFEIICAVKQRKKDSLGFFPNLNQSVKRAVNNPQREILTSTLNRTIKELDRLNYFDWILNKCLQVIAQDHYISNRNAKVQIQKVIYRINFFLQNPLCEEPKLINSADKQCLANFLESYLKEIENLADNIMIEESKYVLQKITDQFREIIDDIRKPLFILSEQDGLELIQSAKKTLESVKVYREISSDEKQRLLSVLRRYLDIYTNIKGHFLTSSQLINELTELIDVVNDDSLLPITVNEANEVIKDFSPSRVFSNEPMEYISPTKGAPKGTKVYRLISSTEKQRLLSVLGKYLDIFTVIEKHFPASSALINELTELIDSINDPSTSLTLDNANETLERLYSARVFICDQPLDYIHL